MNNEVRFLLVNFYRNTNNQEGVEWVNLSYTSNSLIGGIVMTLSFNRLLPGYDFTIIEEGTQKELLDKYERFCK